MKSFGIVLIGAAVAVAQIPANTPACGVTCINNMVAKAPMLGCTAGDLVCYCNTPDFGFGIRDCSNQSCPNAEDAQAALSAGITYCSTILAGAGQSNSTGAGSSTGSGASSAAPTTTAITTSALTSAYTTDGGSVVTTTTGSTTISGYNGTPIVGGVLGGAGGATGASSAASSAATGASSGATSVPTTTAITTSALTSVGTSNGSAFTTTTGSTTISGYNGTPIAGGAAVGSGASSSTPSVMVTSNGSPSSTAATTGTSGSPSASRSSTAPTTTNGAMKTAAPAFLGLAAFAVLAL